MIGAALFSWGLGGAFFGAHDAWVAMLGGVLVMGLGLSHAENPDDPEVIRRKIEELNRRDRE